MAPFIGVFKGGEKDFIVFFAIGEGGEISSN
jgi:hypothetical protein